MTDDVERAEAIRAFRAAVNMQPAALRRWLATEASQSVGMLPGGSRKTAAGGGESVGHHMGTRIVALKAKKQAELDRADLADMRKVAAFVRRHLAERPAGDVTETRWRRSLMNWGHDPLK